MYICDNKSMKTSSDKYFIYARKSTKGDDTSRRFRSKASLTFSPSFVSRARSPPLSSTQSSSANRRTLPAVRSSGIESLRRIEAGEANGIIAWHPDRLARNSRDGGEIIYLLDTGKLD